MRVIARLLILVLMAAMLLANIPLPLASSPGAGDLGIVPDGSETFIVGEGGEELTFSSHLATATDVLSMIDMEGVYDWYDGNVPVWDTRISYDRDDIIFSLEHFYQDGERSLWTPRIDLYPKGNISLEAYGRYDDNDNDLQEIAVIGYMNRCCMRYGLGYYSYDDGEQQIMFSIGLSAFPEARISSGF